LDIAQIISLFIELRDLARQIIIQQQQMAEMAHANRPVAPDDVRLLTVAQTAKTLACSPQTVYRLIEEGELIAVGQYARLRIPLSSVRDYIERHKHD
jgi:excisionase family DNA binding protein